MKQRKKAEGDWLTWTEAVKMEVGFEFKKRL